MKLAEMNKDEPDIVFREAKPIETLEPSAFCNAIKDWGMTCDFSHKVTTSDNYVLQLFNLKKSTTAAGAKVVFLQHGLFSSANTWINNGTKSIPYVLANAGYDVWFGNNRGTTYSRANTKINPDKSARTFFDYSFYELGQYDDPAQIDEVLSLTSASTLSYIGHSQGTT